MARVTRPAQSGRNLREISRSYQAWAGQEFAANAAFLPGGRGLRTEVGKNGRNAPWPGSVGAEQIAGKDLLHHIGQFRRMPVGDDQIGLGLEVIEVADHGRAEAWAW